MPQLTKNEAKKYLQELANRYWKEKGMTRKEYDRLCGEVSILPLNLTMYPQLSEESIKWINLLFDEEDTDSDGNYMLRGFTRREILEMEKLGMNYGDYADAYSFYAYNDKEFMVYTYCEGDTTLKIFADKASYDKEKAECLAWWKEAKS